MLRKTIFQQCAFMQYKLNCEPLINSQLGAFKTENKLLKKLLIENVEISLYNVPVVCIAIFYT